MASRGPVKGPAEPASKPSAGTQSVNTTAPQNAASNPSSQLQLPGDRIGKKKKKHRAGKKRRNRRQSFAALHDGTDNSDTGAQRPSLLDTPESHSAARESFYRLGRRNASNTSLESQALLDHRDSAPLQARRQSVQQGMSGAKGSNPSLRLRPVAGYSQSSASQNRSRLINVQRVNEPDGDGDATDRTPLIGTSYRHGGSIARAFGGYGGVPSSPSRVVFGISARRPSVTSSRSSRPGELSRTKSHDFDGFDVNNPPSVPPSPKLGPDMGYADVMLAGDDVSRGRSTDDRRGGDALIDIDEDHSPRSSPRSNREFEPAPLRRRMTLARAEDDVCFPQEVMSEIAEEDIQRAVDQESLRRPRRRRRKWPDLQVLEEWAIEEKEQRTLEGIRARKVSEPILVGGRLRPRQTVWHRDHEDAPFRFTYFNEEVSSTIHSQTISELLQPDQTFEDLFIPKPPVLDESSDDEDESPPHVDGQQQDRAASQFSHRSPTPATMPVHSESSLPHSRTNSQQQNSSGQSTGHHTPTPGMQPGEKPTKYGPAPVFWLDVLSPTDAEMKVLSKAFGIHPLTAEDIMMQEAREKVELFRYYYFVNYRTFEQDANSEDYLEPVNMYVVVFREGVISFHFSQTPHPANVRRRIRQLSDYLFLTTDWISYAIIDDITDAYAPLIQRIEEEVDDIDDAILSLHTLGENADKQAKLRGKDKEFEYEKQSEAGDKSTVDNAGDMLRRVGECRKKVMGLYRLLGNKADVIKGFAKRCTEQWEVAPRSEIGLYLGDIQDHIVTMTGNLSHYENLLSRAHSNYLAQINLRMNKRAEKTNDVLGKLTVLGTIVLPMNIVTGMWGMNVLVPGQDVESLWWFWSITAGLLVFGFTSYLIAKRAYGIV